MMPDYEDFESDTARAVRLEREACARIAESFAKDYGAEVGRMAKRIAEVIRRQASPRLLTKAQG